MSVFGRSYLGNGLTESNEIDGGRYNKNLPEQQDFPTKIEPKGKLKGFFCLIKILLETIPLKG